MNQGFKFGIELMNPTPSYKHGKDGNQYFIKFEIKEEAWNEFKNANLSGMVLDAEMEVVECYLADVAAEMAPKLKRHHLPLELKAYELCRNRAFQLWVCDASQFPANEYGVGEYIKKRCGVTHRHEIDKNKKAAMKFGKMLKEYEDGIGETLAGK